MPGSACSGVGRARAPRASPEAAEQLGLRSPMPRLWSGACRTQPCAPIMPGMLTMHNKWWSLGDPALGYLEGPKQAAMLGQLG